MEGDSWLMAIWYKEWTHKLIAWSGLPLQGGTLLQRNGTVFCSDHQKRNAMKVWKCCSALWLGLNIRDLDWETYPSRILQLHLWPKLPGTCHMYHRPFAPVSARRWCTSAEMWAGKFFVVLFLKWHLVFISHLKKLVTFPSGVPTRWQLGHCISFPTPESNFEAFRFWKSATPWIFSRHRGSVRQRCWNKCDVPVFGSAHFQRNFQTLQTLNATIPCKIKLLIYQLMYLRTLALGRWECKLRVLCFVSPGLVRFQHGKHGATEVSVGLTCGLVGDQNLFLLYTLTFHSYRVGEWSILARSIKFLWSAQIENLKYGLLLLLMHFFKWHRFRFLSHLLRRDPELLFSIVFISPVIVESRGSN